MTEDLLIHQLPSQQVSTYENRPAEKALSQCLIPVVGRLQIWLADELGWALRHSGGCLVGCLRTSRHCLTCCDGKLHFSLC